MIENSILDIDESSPVRVKCEVDASPDSSSIEWRRPELPEGTKGSESNVVISNGSILELKSVKHSENSGVYECIAHNSMKDSFGVQRKGKSSAEVELNIRFAPQITITSRKIAVNLNNSFQNITCKTSANPVPIFNWYKNGVKLNSLPQSKYIIGLVIARNKNLYENTMKITELNEGDLNSVYECEAINGLGGNKAKVELVPQSQPDRPTEMRELFVDFMSISLSWLHGFDGGLEQYFQIQLNDTVLKEKSTDSDPDVAYLINTGPSSVNITNVKPNTVYSIRMIAINKIGSSEWSDRILVRTNDLTNKQLNLLPLFESVFLNVPKNKLEFKLKQSSAQIVNSNDIDKINYCLKINVSMSDEKEISNIKYELPKCLFVKQLMDQNYLLFDELSNDDLELGEKSNTSKVYFKSKHVRSMKVSICFYLKNTICSEKSTSVVIGKLFITYIDYYIYLLLL